MTGKRLLPILVWAFACTPAGEPANTMGDGSTGETTSAAESDATGGSTGSHGDRYHPDGFIAAKVHGMAMKFHDEDCRSCHGEDLAGGTSEVSCDSCHAPQWRTDCTFCHGGTNDMSGAPPRDLDGETSRELLSFIAHDRHVSAYEHGAYDCTECHRKPTDVLSEGHVFDDTIGAEEDFSLGLSAGAQYDGAGGCSSLYCHGNGRVADGMAAHDMPAPDCGGCHPMTGTTNTAYATMSGRHSLHLLRGFACQECHDPTALETHVDGKADTVFAAVGFEYDASSHTCTGTCHNESHFSRVW